MEKDEKEKGEAMEKPHPDPEKGKTGEDKFSSGKHVELLKKQNRPVHISGFQWKRMFNIKRETHTKEIFKIAAVSSVIILLILFCIYEIQKWNKARELAKKLDDVAAHLKVYDDEISSSVKYKKDKAVIEAVNWVEYAEANDPENYKKWMNLKGGYLKKLEACKPESGSNFVNVKTLTDMVNIPRGRFFMGRRARETGMQYDELPRRSVTITYEFWMSRTEITNAQMHQIFPDYESGKWNSFDLGINSKPAVRVDWNTANNYCALLCSSEKEKGRLPDGYEYRLPTEAEWEYACRAGTETYYYWGDSFGNTGAFFANSLDRRAASALKWKTGADMADSDGHIVSAPCASYKPNAFGLYDMLGNAWEWCWDWYNPKAYVELPDTDPVQKEPVVTTLEMRTYFERQYTIEAASRVLRGCCWGNLPADCRSAARDSDVPDDKKDTGIGFRIVLAPLISSLQSGKKEETKKKTEYSE